MLSRVRPPSSLTATRRLSTTPRRPSRLAKYGRRTGYLALGVGIVYVVDTTFNASAIVRNLRTLQTVRAQYDASIYLTHGAQCAAITLDYKLNFTEAKSDLIPELHQRVGDRMYNLFTSNGGLYIKMGVSS